MRIIAICAVLAFSTPAFSHDRYVGKTDPITGSSCCTTSANDQYGDCAILKVEPGMLEGVPEGYRIRLTAEQAQRINPLRQAPVDTVIPWDRMQPSMDGNYHLCLPRFPAHAMLADFYCFFAPGSF